MSSRMQRNADFLRVLSKCNNKQRIGILQSSDSDLIKCICEISLNLLRGVIPVSTSHKKKLKRHKNLLKLLIDKKESIKKKRQHLTQRGGGFLSLLIPPALSILGNLISKAVTGK